MLPQNLKHPFWVSQPSPLQQYQPPFLLVNCDVFLIVVNLRANHLPQPLSSTMRSKQTHSFQLIIGTGRRGAPTKDDNMMMILLVLIVPSDKDTRTALLVNQSLIIIEINAYNFLSDHQAFILLHSDYLVDG
jgi:hypothetical protein